MSEPLLAIFDNGVLWWGLAACGVAQLSKLVIELVVHRRWNPRVLVETGGMPSSHSALLTGTTAALDWLEGFGGPLFGLAAVLCFVVLYDASGVRRAAGLTADKTTYPKLLGLEESRQRADALVAEAKAALAPWQASAAPLLALADYITSRDR